MTRRTVIVVVLAVAGLLVALRLLQSGAEVPPLTFAGTIEQRDAQIGSLVGGRVLEVPLDEGAVVHRGDLIVRLEPDLLARQVEEGQAAARAADAALQRALNGPRAEELQRAKILFDNAERERQRLAVLVQQDLMQRQQLDDATANAAALEQSWQELAHGTRPEDVELARAASAQAAARLAFLQRQLQELEVRAPADGVLQTLDLRPGDLVAPHQAVASLLEEGQLWVRVYVPETQLGLVRVGQRAAISVDTFPDRSFAGRVVSIRERAEYTPRNVQTLDQRADQVFGVKVAVDPTPELKAGMAALVRLSDGG